ncbi:MAG: hypothetical protein HY918_03170 [Candidatus Doudnabacteria bacterium]|nr:hypothetical protein [Candidatus Doudnabacteria bacterium]
MLKHCQKIGSFIYDCFPLHLKGEIKELYWSTAIRDFAVAAVAIFEPLYLYSLGWTIKSILWFFLGIYVFYFFIMPVGGKIAKKHGFEHGISYSTPFLVLYYLSLLAVPYHPLFIFTAIFALAWQKTFFWPGYHSDFAHYGQEEERGREVVNIQALDSAVLAIGPFFGGMVLWFFDFNTLFILVSLLILGSNIPLMRTREKFPPSPYPFAYFSVYKRLLSKEHRRKFFSYLGYGEEIVLMVIWPLFIFTALKGYFSVGAIITASSLITLFIILFIGRFADVADKHSVLRAGSVISSFAWLFRLLISGVWGIFLVDAFSRVSKQLVCVPLLSITYDHAARKGDIVKRMVFLEMSIVIGKILAILILLILSH